jgi:small-conductance mechanosensitive channel
MRHPADQLSSRTTVRANFPVMTRMRYSIAGLGFTAGLCLLQLATPANMAYGQDTAAETADAEPLPPIDELIVARQELQEILFSIGDFDTTAFVTGPEEQIADLRAELEPVSDVVDGGELDTLDLDALLNLELDIRSEIAELDSVAATLSARASLRDQQIDRLEEQRSHWNNLRAAAEQREAPAEILGIAVTATSLLDQTEADARTDRDAVLRLLSGILDLQLDAAAFNREIRGRRQALEASRQLTSGLPIWHPQLAITPQQLEAGRAALDNFTRSIREYLADNGLLVLVWFLGSGLITWWLLRAGRTKVGEFLHWQDTTTGAQSIFATPGAAALLVGLIGVLLLAPSGPVAVADILIALLPWPAARLATMVFAKPVRLSVYVLAAALCFISLRPVYESLPLASRAGSLVATLAVAGAFYADFRRGNWQRALESINAPLLRFGASAVSVVLLVVLLTDVIGYVGIANTLRTLVLGGLGYGLIFIVLSEVLKSLAMALMQTRALGTFSTVRHAPWAIIRFVKKLIYLVAVVGWLTLTLSLSGLSTRFWGAAEQLLSTEVPIGAVSIRIGSVAAGLLVIWLTWLTSRLVRFVMANRAIDYRSAASGLSFALSKVLSYAIIVVGFLLALSAIGFDITRVTVLAGALGVGIGLGLQNIANNFVSGIILLFERPVQVNDIAKVDETLGTIKEIGIRSTIIQTFDGAEVIVPNADFMAKTVLNWTKSNRFRRAEIDVGVAYGTDTGKVLDILNAAARSHESVLNDPEPFATFCGFGDSSLNFRLYVWVSDLQNYLRVPSAIRQQILSELNSAGVEIPFPQRDVRVTMSAEVPDATAQS